MLDLLPPELVRKVVEHSCGFLAAEEPDPRTTLALLGTCRALGRLVMAPAPRRTLTFSLVKQQQQQQQQEWPAGLTSLVLALSPPDLKLVIKSSTSLRTRAHVPPPQPLWSFITSLRLRYVEMTEQVLAALQLHQWPRLVEVEVDNCTVTPSDPPATHLLQPLPHLRTLRIRAVVSEDQLRAWAPLAHGPNLRVLGLHSGEHLDMFLGAAEQATHMELYFPRDEDIRRLAQLPQLQHVTFGDIDFLTEDFRMLDCPWASMCLEFCCMERVRQLPLGSNLRTLTIGSVGGSRDSHAPDSWHVFDDAMSAVLSHLRRHQATLSVVVEGSGAGTWRHRQWRLGRRERVVAVVSFNRDLLRWLMSSCADSVGVLELANPISSWEEAMAPLHESGRVHTLCLWADACTPEVAAALPACIRHVKARAHELTLKGVVPFVAALPAHVQRLSLLIFRSNPQALRQVKRAQAARRAPLALSVWYDEEA